MGGAPLPVGNASASQTGPGSLGSGKPVDEDDALSVSVLFGLWNAINGVELRKCAKAGTFPSIHSKKDRKVKSEMGVLQAGKSHRACGAVTSVLGALASGDAIEENLLIIRGATRSRSFYGLWM